MPRHIEGDDPEVARDFEVVEQRAELASVGTRRVQTQQRDAFARLLDI